METQKWMVYGAYGYTGMLICQEALRRGHKPVLAGRSEDKLAAVAKTLNLDYLVFDLEDETELSRIVADFALVLHAAGPFIHTCPPMLRACLKGKTHYVDITGEIPVFEQAFAQDEEAKKQGIALLSGAGFDVVPTDCAAKYVAEQVQEANELELAIGTTGHASSGTTKTMIEHLSKGTFRRINGKLVRQPEGKGMKRISFSDRERTVVPISWGDLSTAYRTTKIPNITTYMAFPARVAKYIRVMGPINRCLFSLKSIRRFAQNMAEKKINNPDEETREKARSFVWAKAQNAKGEAKEVWLETAEGYHFTALSSVRIVEKILAQNLSGALTPAAVFGADFVLEIEGTKRFDQL